MTKAPSALSVSPVFMPIMPGCESKRLELLMGYLRPRDWLRFWAEKRFRPKSLAGWHRYIGRDEIDLLLLKGGQIHLARLDCGNGSAKDRVLSRAGSLPGEKRLPLKYYPIEVFGRQFRQLLLRYHCPIQPEAWSWPCLRQVLLQPEHR